MSENEKNRNENELDDNILKSVTGGNMIRGKCGLYVIGDHGGATLCLRLFDGLECYNPNCECQYRI